MNGVFSYLIPVLPNNRRPVQAAHHQGRADAEVAAAAGPHARQPRRRQGDIR